MSTCTVGIPREVKFHEGRVGMTPSGVRSVVELGGSGCCRGMGDSGGMGTF